MLVEAAGRRGEKGYGGIVILNVIVLRFLGLRALGGTPASLQADVALAAREARVMAKIEPGIDVVGFGFSANDQESDAEPKQRQLEATEGKRDLSVPGDDQRP